MTKTDELAYYTDGVQSLLEATSHAEYNAQLLRFATKWSKPFLEYFLSSVNDRIEQIGRWILRKYALETATTNQSESFNKVLKSLQV